MKTTAAAEIAAKHGDQEVAGRSECSIELIPSSEVELDHAVHDEDADADIMTTAMPSQIMPIGVVNSGSR